MRKKKQTKRQFFFCVLACVVCMLCFASSSSYSPFLHLLWFILRQWTHTKHRKIANERRKWSNSVRAIFVFILTKIFGFGACTHISAFLFLCFLYLFYFLFIPFVSFISSWHINNIFRVFDSFNSIKAFRWRLCLTLTHSVGTAMHGHVQRTARAIKHIVNWLICEWEMCMEKCATSCFIFMSFFAINLHRIDLISNGYTH